MRPRAAVPLHQVSRSIQLANFSRLDKQAPPISGTPDQPGHDFGRSAETPLRRAVTLGKTCSQLATRNDHTSVQDWT